MHRLATLSMALFMTSAGVAQTDTIYPGDANFDGFCNQEDVLLIGLKFGITGPQRDTVATTWGPWASYPWTDTLPNALTTNYTDCNGDGVINEHDMQVIRSNFLMTHDTTLAGTNGFQVIGATQQDPPLDFVVNNLDSVFVSDTIIIPVHLGVINTPAIISGLSFELNFTSELVDTMFVNFDSSMLHPSTARLDFDETDFTAGRARIATVMSNNSIVTVVGNVLNVIIVMEGNIAGKTEILQDTLFLCPDRVLAIDNLGHVVPIYAGCDSLIVYDLDSRVPKPSPTDFTISPNPSNGTFMITSKQNPLEEIIVSNMLGQIVYREEFDGVREEIIFKAPLPSGTYLLTARSSKHNIASKIQIINP